MCRIVPECAGFQAKRKKFPVQLAHVQEEYEEALNSSCTCQKYGVQEYTSYTFSFLEIIPTLFTILPTHF